MPLTALNRYRPWVLLTLAASLVLLIVWRAGGGFPLDDSWIHQAYGRNLGTGGEWALIPGQPSAASTAPLYTVLLAVGYALRLPPAPWTHLLGILALWGTAELGARLAQRLAPQHRYAGLLVGLLIVLEWHLLWAAASGMETALFAFWTLLLPWLVWREFDPERTLTGRAYLRRGAIFGAVAALAVLTRPEGLGIAGLSGLGLLFAWAGQRRGLKPLALWLSGAAVGFALFVAPYLWLNLELAGSLLPNTSAAKQAQHAPLLALSYPRRVWMMLVPLLAGSVLMLLPGLVWFAVRARQRVFGWVLWLWPLSLVLLYAARLPAAYQHGRYVIPAIPALIVCGGVGLLWLLRVGRRSRLGRVTTRALLMGTLLLTVIMALTVLPGVYTQDVAIINQEMVAAAAWIDANLPADELLAIHDIGAVAYFTPRPILDVAGLVSPQVVPIVNDADALWALMQQRDAAYLMAFPDQIPGDDPNDPRLCLAFDTDGTASPQAGGPNMRVYGLIWGDDVPAACNA